MAADREQMEQRRLGALADIVASGSVFAPSAEAEILRRQTVAQQEAAEAQKRAADAQEVAAGAALETAEFT
jgi:hypothetical protein